MQASVFQLGLGVAAGIAAIRNVQPAHAAKGLVWCAFDLAPASHSAARAGGQRGGASKACFQYRNPVFQLWHFASCGNYLLPFHQFLQRFQ